MRSILVALAIVSLTVSGCASDTSQPAADGKYVQSWSKSYTSTSCDEWLNAMDPQQRFAAAADMLTGARNKGDGGTGVPEDALIDGYTEDVDSTCELAARSLAEAGALTYVQARSEYRP